jgi:transposase
MKNQPPSYNQNTAQLEARISALEAALLEKNAVITVNESAITDKDSAIQKLTQDVAYLSFQNDQLRRLIFGSKRERFIPQEHPSQPQLPFEAETISKVVKEEQEKIRLEYERKKVKKEHPGRMPLPSHLPVNEIVLEPSEDTTNMICIGQEVTEELDYTPAKLHINRYIRNKYITKEDEKADQKQVIAPLNRPLHKCIASANLLGMVFINKYLYHLPVYRTRQMLIQMGITIPDSTLESWIKLGANLLQPLYAIHRLHVFKEVYQMIDESPIKVQDHNKKGTCHQGYMWVRYAPLSKSVLFEYYKSRSANGPIDDLNTFSGFIQTDGYSGYTFLAQKQGLTHLSCWAHVRRYFDVALNNDKERASYVLSLIQIIYSIEALARDKNLSHEQRHALRLEKSLPVINAIGAYIYQNKGFVTPKSPIGKAFEYCSNRWASLQNYLKNGMLEIDSNLVENSIRPLALGRKNYLFAGSHDAAINVAMFYSFFGTCKKLDIDSQKWLKYVMENIHITPASNFKELLPQFIDKNLLQ